MVRRETGVWLPISAVAVGLAFFGSGLAFWELDTHISIRLFISSGVGILAGPFFPWLICLSSYPWRIYHRAAFFFGSVPLLCCIAIWFWQFEQHHLAPVCACLLMIGLEAWLGAREFLSARESLHAVKQSVESH
jgi:hypothetical protein